MSNVFLISDTHFFHHKVIEFEAKNRPFATVEEMNEALVDNWNKTVSKRDTVYHLGDVLFGGPKNINILDRLNGNKKLILGNHDEKITARMWLTKFRDVHGALKYDNHIFTHVPIHPDQFYRFTANVHGHLHGKIIMLDDQPDRRYINVSVEQINLTPQAWEDVKKRGPQ